MLPALLRGEYAEPEIAVDLRPLCRAAGVRLIRAAAEGVDGHARTVRTREGPLEFDLASLDVGADPGGLDDVPGGGAREHAHTARPIARAVSLERALAGVPPGSPICVVGGGAAGVEVALAIHARLRAGASGPPPSVTLVERADTLLPGERPRLRRLAGRVLAGRGVRVRTGAPVVRVDADAIALASGESIPSSFTVWLTGAAPGPVLLHSALPKSADGWLLVDRTLRAVDGAPVWGAGDCVTLRDFPWTPKAGVYAVRAGPVLAHNLRAAVEGRPPRPFVPRRETLAILDTADGRAILRWGPLACYGRPAWWLKRWIDTRFVASYRLDPEGITRVPAPPPPAPP
jgi:selenide,water dikinase